MIESSTISCSGNLLNKREGVLLLHRMGMAHNIKWFIEVFKILFWLWEGYIIEYEFKNMSGAFPYYKLAADQGDTDSQFNVCKFQLESIFFNFVAYCVNYQP